MIWTRGNTKTMAQFVLEGLRDPTSRFYALYFPSDISRYLLVEKYLRSAGQLQGRTEETIDLGNVQSCKIRAGYYYLYLDTYQGIYIYNITKKKWLRYSNSGILCDNGVIITHTDWTEYPTENVFFFQNQDKFTIINLTTGRLIHEGNSYVFPDPHKYAAAVQRGKYFYLVGPGQIIILDSQGQPQATFLEKRLSNIQDMTSDDQGYLIVATLDQILVIETSQFSVNPAGWKVVSAWPVPEKIHSLTYLVSKKELYILFQTHIEVWK